MAAPLDSDPKTLVSTDWLARNLASPDIRVIDASWYLPEDGRDPKAEYNAGLRSGHIPGSKNLHYRALLNADGTMKDGAGLAAAFDAAGIDRDKPVITTCGSGVTAAIVNLALERLGQRDHALYDGSWAEWGRFEQLPVATG